MRERIGLLLYGILSTIEGVLNTLLYITFLDKVFGVFDFSLPVYFWYTDRFLKTNFLKKIKNEKVNKERK
jgi:hypothetical protein